MLCGVKPKFKVYLSVLYWHLKPQIILFEPELRGSGPSHIHDPKSSQLFNRLKNESWS
jgi:hypothetical protein